MLVQEIMVPDLVTVSPSSTLAQAASIMLQNGATSLFVCHDHKLLGLITDSDILYGAVANGLPTDRQIWEFMDFNPPTTSPTTDILDLITVMDRHRLAIVPVVEDGKLIGSVSLIQIAAKMDLM